MLLFLMEFNDLSADAAIDIFQEKIAAGWPIEIARKFASLFQEIQNIPRTDYACLVEVEGSKK